MKYEGVLLAVILNLCLPLSQSHGTFCVWLAKPVTNIYPRSWGSGYQLHRGLGVCGNYHGNGGQLLPLDPVDT